MRSLRIAPTPPQERQIPRMEHHFKVFPINELIPSFFSISVICIASVCQKKRGSSKSVSLYPNPPPRSLRLPFIRIIAFMFWYLFSVELSALKLLGYFLYSFSLPEALIFGSSTGTISGGRFLVVSHLLEKLVYLG
jgi:hypothetical protein